METKDSFSKVSSTGWRLTNSPTHTQSWVQQMRLKTNSHLSTALPSGLSWSQDSGRTALQYRVQWGCPEEASTPTRTRNTPAEPYGRWGNEGGRGSVRTDRAGNRPLDHSQQGCQPPGFCQELRYVRLVNTTVQNKFNEEWKKKKKPKK